MKLVYLKTGGFGMSKELSPLLCSEDAKRAQVVKSEIVGCLKIRIGKCRFG
jgi:hypothetical protein